MRRSFKQLISLLLVFVCVIGLIPSTYAAPADVTDSDECELCTAEAPGLAFVDAPFTTGNADVVGYEDYILANLNRDYVGEGDELIPYDVIDVTYTIADKDAMLANGQELTIDGMWVDADNDGIMDNFDMFLNQIESSSFLYQVSPDADYVVGYVDDFKSDAAELVDWAFTENSLSGLILDDCIYDADTGLIYVPLYYAYSVDNGYVINQTQIQLMYAYSGDVDSASTQVDVIIDTIRVDGTVVNAGTITASMWDNALAIRLAGDEDALASLTSDSIESICVDGAELDLSGDYYYYDAATGTLYVLTNPVATNTVEIVLRNPTALEVAANAILSWFVTPVSATGGAGNQALTYKGRTPDPHGCDNSSYSSDVCYLAHGWQNHLYGSTVWQVASIEELWEVESVPTVGSDITVFANTQLNPSGSVSMTITPDYKNSDIYVGYDSNPTPGVDWDGDGDVDSTNNGRLDKGVYLSHLNSGTISTYYNTQVILQGIMPVYSGNSAADNDGDGNKDLEYCFDGLSNTWVAYTNDYNGYHKKANNAGHADVAANTTDSLRQWHWYIHLPGGTYNLDGTKITTPELTKYIHCGHNTLNVNFQWSSVSTQNVQNTSYIEEQECFAMRILHVVKYCDGTDLDSNGLCRGRCTPKSGRMVVGVLIPNGGHGQSGIGMMVVDWAIPTKSASLKVTKAVSGGTGANLGWQFRLWNDAGTYDKTLWTSTSSSDPSCTFTGLAAGTYKLQEIGGPANGDGDFYELDDTVYTITVTQNQANNQTQLTKTITNEYIQPAKIKVVKTTPTGEGVDWRWHFGLYSAKNTGSSYLLDDGWTKASTTDPSYTFDVDLAPGTYYIKELDDSLTTYNTDKKANVDLNTNWITVTISASDAGKTKTVSHQNAFKYGFGNFKKVAANGSNADLSGWVFEVYSDSACTDLVVTAVTDTNGVAKMFSRAGLSDLQLSPGTYYVKEVDHVVYSDAVNGTYTSSGLWGSQYIYNDPAVTGSNKATIKIEAAKTADLTITNTWGGRIKVQKTTNTGNNKGDWQFTVYTNSACTTVAKDIHGNNVVLTTGTDGTATSNLLPAGTYYVKETGGTLYGNAAWKCDVDRETAAVTIGNTTTVSFSNDHYGRLSLTKNTNTGANKNGWVFTVYTNSACTTVAKDINGNNVTLTTDASGNATSGYLLPGTYYVKETGGLHAGDSWVESTDVKSVTVVAGTTTPVTGGAFVNTQYGKLALYKTTNTGNNKDGWQFTVYMDSACTTVAKDISGNNVVMTTNGDGYAESNYVLPGTYYVKETGGTLYGHEAWTSSTAVKSITVKAGETVVISESFVNTHYGKLSLVKSTNTGNDKGNWVFTVYTNSACTAVAKYKDGTNATLTTDANGNATSGYLLPGDYWVKETGGTLYGNEAWDSSTAIKKVTVVAGSVTPVTGGAFENIHYGKLSLVKNTNTGANKDNWVFTVYTDAACTQIAKYKNGTNATLTTGTDGRATSDYLLPGTYYVKETGGTRYNDPYWVVSTEAKTVKVVAGAVTPVSGGEYMNYHHGRITIQKEMATTGPLNGWNFIVYIDEACTQVALDKNGAQVTMTTDANGQCISGYLLPGTYFIKEIIDEEGGLYYCKTRNPLPVTVVAGVDTRAQSGEKQDVSFINALRPIEIEILKVDPNGNPLPNVTFMLEWSSDGTNWKLIQYSDAEDVVAGYTSSAVNANGELMTGADGLVVFENLHPEYQYRVTETATANGMVLLRDSVIVTPDDVSMEQAESTAPYTRCYEMTVTNSYGWEPTPTGESGLPMLMFVGGGMFLALAGIAMFVMYELNRKKKVVCRKDNRS